MTATQFVCPNHDKILIKQCLSTCPHCIRCMAKPTLETVAKSVADRNLGRRYSVTELLSGTRELYLKKTTDYAINPQDHIFAMHGSAVHSICEHSSSSTVLTEFRLFNDIFTGQIDCYGDVLGNGKKILMDYKVTSSYKAMIALGYYKEEVPTGEIYKSGLKKGQQKMKKVWRYDGVRKLLDWAVQINAYRLLLEEHNFIVDDMYIQLYVRDYSVRMSSERNITKPMYLLHINKISDHWLRTYFSAKKARLDAALKTGTAPGFCSARESWHGRKCSDYCDVHDECKKQYAASLPDPGMAA